MSTVILVENLSKAYQLGQIGTGTLTNDLKLWWAKARGKPNPLLRIGESDHGNRSGETIWALKDVSFEVQQGEALGVIGRNGAGKSTLLKVLSRITAPTSGRVRVRGRIASLLEVGTGFHPELTGRENIYLNGAILGMRRDEVRRKFDEIVDFAGIAQFVDTPVKRYSSGMYVRLAFAVAAHLEPEILLVDEVLAVGDAEFQKKCLGKMSEVASEGRTVLFVSHNMAAIENICSTGLLLNSGSADDKASVASVIAIYIRSNNENCGDLSDSIRTGNGEIKFLRWEVVDQIYGAGQKIHPLSNPIFKLFYKSTGDFRCVDVTLTIKDVLGQPIVSGLHHFDDVELSQTGSFVCKFEQFNLIPGEYILHLWCSADGETADRIENAGRFEITVRDIYGNGSLSRKSKHGAVIINNNWHIDKYP